MFGRYNASLVKSLEGETHISKYQQCIANYHSSTLLNVPNTVGKTCGFRQQNSTDSVSYHLFESESRYANSLSSGHL